VKSVPQLFIAPTSINKLVVTWLVPPELTVVMPDMEAEALPELLQPPEDLLQPEDMEVARRLEPLEAEETLEEAQLALAAPDLLDLQGEF
jgi:hypothetical protein